MSIAFDLDIDDLLAFYRHYYDTNRQIVRNKRMRMILFPALYVILAFTLRDNLVCFIFLLVCAALMPLYIMWRYKKPLMKKVRKNLIKPENAIFFGTRQMAFDQEGMAVKSENTDEKVKWQALVRWVEVPGYIFLYIAENVAHVIPLAKISREEAAELRTMLDTYIQQPAIS